MSESVNVFINKAIEKQIERDKNGESSNFLCFYFRIAFSSNAV